MAKGVFDNVLSDYLWARAVLLTSPTVTTVGACEDALGALAARIAHARVCLRACARACACACVATGLSLTIPLTMLANLLVHGVRRCPRRAT